MSKWLGDKGGLPAVGVRGTHSSNTTTSGAALSVLAQTFKVLYSFTGGSDGGLPFGPMIRDDKGNLYSAAFTSANGYGNGTIFKFSEGGQA
ncbi:MAG TPA: hypothetical protein VK829_10610 [Terriglobales bacterium]|jgi:hypothetical protein|nr:hypothetical protein [Terriglobales bacterium]